MQDGTTVFPDLPQRRLSEQDFTEARNTLMLRYRDRPLRFGYIGYSSFVDVNGTVGGPAVEFIRHIANDLGTRAEPIRTTWPEVEDSVHESVDIVIDPIMQGRNVGLIAYCTFQALEFIHPVALENEVKGILEEFWRCAHDTPSLAEEGVASEIIAWRDEIKKIFHRLESIGDGLAVTEGTTADRLVTDGMGARACRYPPDSIEGNIRSCYSNGQRVILVVDEPSWCKVRQEFSNVPGMALTASSFAPRGSWIPTGFALARWNDTLATYLLGESVFGSTPRFSSFLAQIDDLPDIGGAIRVVPSVSECRWVSISAPLPALLPLSIATAPLNGQPQLLESEVEPSRLELPDDDGRVDGGLKRSEALAIRAGTAIPSGEHDFGVGVACLVAAMALLGWLGTLLVSSGSSLIMSCVISFALTSLAYELLLVIAELILHIGDRRWM